MRKRSLLLAASACLAVQSVAVSSAIADPPAPTFRNLAGTGANTTQGVMNALSDVITINGIKQIGSYDAATAPGETISTKGTRVCTEIPRESGRYGIGALINDRLAGTHCLQFARSSIDVHTDEILGPGAHLTYIPFATDEVTYGIRGPGGSPTGSSINRNLSIATPKQIYTQTGTACIGAFEPLLPFFGTGTRQYFLENILGLGPGADVVNYAGPQGLHPCVKDTDAGGNFLIPNTGNLLTNDKQIEPYAVSSWTAQTTKNVPDVHGITLLGNIADVPSVATNTTATGISPSPDRLADNLRSPRQGSVMPSDLREGGA